MKNRMTICLFIFLFAASGVMAQESYSGIKGGVNLSNLTSSEGDYDDNMKVGFHVGVFNKIAVSDVFAVQPELLYSAKGLKLDYDDSAMAEGESKFNLNYIDLPVKLVLNVSDYFDLQFGPYVSYLISANIDNDAELLGGIDVDGEEELDRDNFNTLDYGLTAGIGFDLHPLVIGLNYNLGLNPVAKDDEPSEQILGDAKNTNIMVSVGLKF
ncbi:MAG: porin family protein [Prolixibacteraceae bacterium]